MRKVIEPFQYLTQDLRHRTHEEQVAIACEAGVKWIQLRVKNRSFEEWLEIATRVKQIATGFDVILIINDNITIAREVDADGVHLGREDESWREARKLLGNDKIIGFSTHSLDELLIAKNFDVDYFGLGPFHFTNTKETLDPVLGLEGIKMIVSRARESAINKPIIAVGGIQLSDMSDLLKTGANGIAVSSTINLAANPYLALKGFQQCFQMKQLTIN